MTDSEYSAWCRRHAETFLDVSRELFARGEYAAAMSAFQAAEALTSDMEAEALIALRAEATRREAILDAELDRNGIKRRVECADRELVERVAKTFLAETEAALGYALMGQLIDQRLGAVVERDGPTLQ